MKLWQGIESVKTDPILEKYPNAGPFVCQNLHALLLDWCHPITPVIIGTSSYLDGPQEDWNDEERAMIKWTGFWIIPEEEQRRRLERKDSKFGGEDMNMIEIFLAKGPPVYLGWGSMV